MIKGKSFRLKSQIIPDSNEPNGIIMIDGRSGTMVSCDQSAAQLCAKPRRGAAAGALARCLVWTYDVRELATERGVVRFPERHGK